MSSNNHVVQQPRPGRAGLRVLTAFGLTVLCLVLTSIAADAPPDRRVISPERRATQPAPAEPLTDEQVEVVMEFMAAAQPRAAEGLRQLKESDPKAYRQAVQRMAGGERVRHLLAIQRSDPEGFAVKAGEFHAAARAERLGREAREGKGDSEALHKQLRQAAEEVIDARLKVRERDLVELEKRLADLRTQLKSQHEHRDELIERYYQHLMKPREAVSP